MADTKISALTGATTPLAGTEVIPVVQGGETRKVSIANLTAGRAISATSVTASTGNFVVGTSGQGIDFSATPGTGTSELLADYEEGTFNAQITDSSTPANNAVMNAFVCRYTKIGRQVTIQGNVSTSSVAGLSGSIRFAGLPYALGAFASGVIGEAAGLAITAGYSIALTGNTGNSYLALKTWDAATGTTNVTPAKWSDDGNIVFSFVYTV